MKVLPDRLPDVFVLKLPRCPPGSTCNFPVTIANVGQATDVFSISVEEKYIPTGWSIDCSKSIDKCSSKSGQTHSNWLSATVD